MCGQGRHLELTQQPELVSRYVCAHVCMSMCIGPLVHVNVTSRHVNVHRCMSTCANACRCVSMHVSVCHCFVQYISEKEDHHLKPKPETPKARNGTLKQPLKEPPAPPAPQWKRKKTRLWPFKLLRQVCASNLRQHDGFVEVYKILLDFVDFHRVVKTFF